MPRKGENIRKRKDGRWEGRYKSGVKKNGTPDYKSIYGKTYKEVKDKLLLAKQQLNNDSFPSCDERRFSEVLYLWEQTNGIRLKESSKQRYSYLIRTHILPHLGNLKLSQVSATNVNAFLMDKLSNGRLDGKGGLAPSYVSSIMVIVNSAINFAVAEKMCPPLRTPIYKPQSEKVDMEILSYEAQASIEGYIKNNLNATNIGILISLYTGLRIGEICALSWNDVDLKERIIHVRHTVARIKNNNENEHAKTRLIIGDPKTKASRRDIPIPSAILPSIIEYRKISHSQYVVSDKECFISPRTYEYRYHRVLAVCGVASVNYHTLRHTFASRCIEVGVDVKSLSEILGHGNSSITLNTYVHSTLNLKRCQLEKLTPITA